MCGRVIAYFLLSKGWLSAILDFSISTIFVKNWNLCLYLRCLAKFGEDRTMSGRVIVYFRFSKWRPFAILDFYVTAIFLKNSNLCLYLRHLAKFGEDRTMRGRVIAYFRLSKWRSSTILDFHVFAIFVKNSNLYLNLHRCAQFGEDRTMCGRVIAYVPFSKWWLSAILDLVWRHRRPSMIVFDGPNILLKLHVDHVNILRYHYFYIWPVWLQIAYSCPFLGSLGTWRVSHWNWVPAQGVKKLQCSAGQKFFR